MRCISGLMLPMNVARSEMNRWTELADTLQSPGAIAWEYSQRAYIETANERLVWLAHRLHLGDSDGADVAYAIRVRR